LNSDSFEIDVDDIEDELSEDEILFE